MKYIDEKDGSTAEKQRVRSFAKGLKEDLKRVKGRRKDISCFYKLEPSPGAEAKEDY